MIEVDWRLLTALGLLGLWIFHRISQSWGAWRRSRRAKKRGARAVQGERDAEQLLEDAGFEILERQLPKVWTLTSDGEAVDFDLRADLLVRRDGQDFIAEVKTGQSAPDLRNAATRRQLLEYALAYQSSTILLVDVERDEIHEIEFSLDAELLPAETMTAPTLAGSAGQ